MEQSTITPIPVKRTKLTVLSALRQLHAWIGFALSLMVAVIALSGCALVFKTEWLKLTVPGAARPVSSDALTSAAAAEAAERAFGATAVRSVVLASPEFGLHQVYLRDETGAYLDARDGRVVQSWRKNERVVDWLFDLHHHLLSGKTGTKISGWIGVAAALMVLTGLAVWGPAARSFRGGVAPRSLRRASLLAAHRDLGVMAAPFILILTLSGASVALPETARPLVGATRGVKPPTLPSNAENRAAIDWARVISTAQARFPAAQIRVIVWPDRGAVPAEVRLRQPEEWHANGRTVVWTTADGALLRTDDAEKQGAGTRLFNSFWPVHTSRVGGLVWKVTTVLAGLSLAALSLYGTESFRRRLSLRKSSRRDGQRGTLAT